MCCRVMKKRPKMADAALEQGVAPCEIRKANPEDFQAIYDIFQTVLNTGDTYSYTPEEMTPERAMLYWMADTDTHCHVADIDGKVVGCYAIRPNRTGRARHVANASYIVDPAYRNRGIGRALGEHAILQGKELGYASFQFNFVVSVNEAAVKLWQSLGFKIAGTLPKVFNHATKGLVDVYVMHRFL